jgi:osmotically-inducible protein OsmY
MSLNIITTQQTRLPRRALLLAAVTAALLNTACAPILLGGAVMGGTLVATDRRTSGTQVEDEGIELKVGQRIRDQLGDRVHVNVNSYNRVVLLTGEVRADEDKEALGRIAGGVENVTKVLDETAVAFHSSISSRSSDLLVQSKIKATLIDAKDLISNAFYVVVERGNVYLMGRVTEREARRASDLIAGIQGVKKVVRCFEIISEEDLANQLPRPSAKQP